MAGERLRGQTGVAAVEFAVVATVLLTLLWAVVEFGALIQAQAVVSNISREGGALASRDLNSGVDLLALLEASSSPLQFSAHPEKFKIYLAKVEAGESFELPDPTCTVQQRGALSGPGVNSPLEDTQCSLTLPLYDLLKFDEGIGTSPLPQFTVVKIYYAHRFLTPLEGFMKISGHSLLDIDTDGDALPDSMLIHSQAIF